jgi:hypothetical protein
VVHDYVAGGTGQRSFASTFEVDIVLVSDLKYGQAFGRVYLVAGSV